MCSTIYWECALMINLLVLMKLQSVLDEWESEQKIATSSEWIQLWAPIPKLEQERRQDSFPEHSSSSSQIWPEPDRKLHAEEVIVDKTHFEYSSITGICVLHHWLLQVDHYHEVYSLLLVVCCLATNTLNMDYRRIGWGANGVAIELAMQLS